jgi:hypothetical protein
MSEYAHSTIEKVESGAFSGTGANSGDGHQLEFPMRGGIVGFRARLTPANLLLIDVALATLVIAAKTGPAPTWTDVANIPTITFKNVTDSIISVDPIDVWLAVPWRPIGIEGFDEPGAKARSGALLRVRMDLSGIGTPTAADWLADIHIYVR